MDAFPEHGEVRTDYSAILKKNRLKSLSCTKATGYIQQPKRPVALIQAKGYSTKCVSDFS